MINNFNSVSVHVQIILGNISLSSYYNLNVILKVTLFVCNLNHVNRLFIKFFIGYI